MSAGTLDKLIYMANQIATAFRYQEEGQAAEATYDHIWHFWDPRMRSMIIEHWQAGGEGLNPVARTAIGKLLRQGEPAPVTKATEFSHLGDPDLMSDAG